MYKLVIAISILSLTTTALMGCSSKTSKTDPTVEANAIAEDCCGN